MHNLFAEPASHYEVPFQLLPRSTLAGLTTRLQLEPLEATTAPCCFSREGAALPYVQISETISPTVLRIIKTDQRTFLYVMRWLQSASLFHRVSKRNVGMSFPAMS